VAEFENNLVTLFYPIFFVLSHLIGKKEKQNVRELIYRERNEL
jgi:hypothetical protein